MGFEPVHVRARFDGHAFVPETPVNLPQGAILEGWAEVSEQARPQPRFGSAKGKIHMAENFDAPLEEFAEYM